MFDWKPNNKRRSHWDRARHPRSLEAEVIEALQKVCKHLKPHPDSKRGRREKLRSRALKQWHRTHTP